MTVTDLTARRLQALVASEQATTRMPSLVAGLVRDGEIVWSGRHGPHAGDVEPGHDVQYRVGSITKTMTAVLVMQLRDEGALGLSDRLGDHVPGVPYGDRTVRSLLAHSSGMRSEPPGPWWERSPGVGFDGLAARLDDSDAPFEPWATFHYTNLGYGLLGELVARLRGGTWWEVLDELVLRPLEMRRTTYDPQPPVATGYSVQHFSGTLTEEPAQDTRAMAPAGQLWSTVTDLCRYARFLLDGQDDVLAATTVAEMRTPQSGSLTGGLSGGYGLGLRLIAGGSGTLAGHTGSMPGFLAGLFVDPIRRAGAVCLANGTAGMRGEGLPVALLEELENSEPTIVPAWTPSATVPDAVAEILGLWHWGNTAHAFTWDDGEVVITSLASGVATSRLRLVDDGTFLGTAGYHHGERLSVRRNPDGSVNHLECATFVYTREPYDPRAPIPGGHPED